MRLSTGTRCLTALIAAIQIFTLTAFTAESAETADSPILFLGNTEPGGVLGRRHQQRIQDGAKFALASMPPSRAKKCASSLRPESQFLFEPGLSVNVEQLVRIAADRGANAGIGYLYSGEGVVAADVADKLHFPIISPGATVDELFHHPYFRSLGLSVREQARIVASWVSETNPDRRSVMIVTPIDQLFSLRLAKALKTAFGLHGIKLIESNYVSTDVRYADNVSAEINKSDSNIIIFSGYWNTSFPIIKRLIADHRMIIGNSEWTYNEDVLANGLDIPRDVYMVADYAPSSITSTPSKQTLPSLYRVKDQLSHFNTDFKKSFGYSPTALVASVFDTTNLVCSVLESVDHPTRDSFMKAFGRYGEYWGVKGLYYLSPDKLKRSAYLTRWNGKIFEGLKEFTAEM